MAEIGKILSPLPLCTEWGVQLLDEFCKTIDRYVVYT